MRKSRIELAYCVFGILLIFAASAIHAAPQEANFVGTWNLTVTGGQGGGGHQGGDQGEGQSEGGGRRGGKGGAQTITITKDGDNFKVDHKTPRGDVVSNATVSGNTISWTEERQGRDGNSRKIQFKATVDGDSLTGTMAGGPGSRDFTAKRAG
jgi:hypothetical protein